MSKYENEYEYEKAMLIEDVKKSNSNAIPYTEVLDRFINVELTTEQLSDLYVTLERNGLDIIGDTIENIDKKLVDDKQQYVSLNNGRTLRVKIRDDGHIDVCMHLNDGSIHHMHGAAELPSMLYAVTFNRWSSVLKELEEMINDPKLTESDLQNYFEIHRELLCGNDYNDVIPQAVITYSDERSWKSDFVLAPCNQNEFAKILEIKLPSMDIINKSRAGHIIFSAKLWGAIQQIKDYKHAFDNDGVREKFKRKYNVDVYRPDLHIIAGRNFKYNIANRLLDLQKDLNIKIETWDMVLEKLKNKYT